MEKEINVKQIKQEILQAYFAKKSSDPKELKDPIPCHKTTNDIIDDLAPMVEISQSDVQKWMINHNFVLCTDIDGSVKWRIFEERQG